MNSLKKKICCSLLVLSFPFFCHAQFFGIAGQYAQHSDGQFETSLAIPTFCKKNPLNVFVTSGLEYTTGNAKIAGLNIKPISINTFFSEKLFQNTPFTILAGVDGGYNINFGHGNDGFIVSPNIYFDYSIFFIKTGYDFDISNHQQQYFVRAGVCIGLGLFKHLLPSMIW